MAAVVPIGPQCSGCAGGGDVNGVLCAACDGSGRVRAASRRGRLRSRLLALAHVLAVPAGTAVRWSMSLPGLLGAAGVSYGLAATAHGLVPRVPLVPALLLMAGVFALALDRQLP